MRFGINNPAFLQEASAVVAVKEFITLGLKNKGQLFRVSGEGVCKIVFLKNEQPTTITLDSPDDYFFNEDYDENSTITLNGKITGILGSPGSGQFNELLFVDTENAPSLTTLNVGYSMLTSIDVTKNKKIRSLTISGSDVESIDLSANEDLYSLLVDNTKIIDLDITKNSLISVFSFGGESLESLSLGGINPSSILSVQQSPNISTISLYAINECLSTYIATLIENATSVDGTVTLRHGDEYNQIIIDAALEKGWDVQYFD